MPQKTSKATNPWAALDALMKTDPEPTGPEWFTVVQYTQRYGGSRSGNAAKLAFDPRLASWKGLVRSTGKITIKYRVK